MSAARGRTGNGGDRRTRGGRRFALAALAGLAVPFGEAAAAQPLEVPTVISPLRVEDDNNNINLATGKTTIAGPTLTVPAAPNLFFDRVQNAAPYVRGRVTGGPGDFPVGNYSLQLGAAASESFLCSDVQDCESVTGTGSTFRPQGMNSFRYQQAGTGAVYTFNLLHVNSGGSPRNIQYYATVIGYPNGEAVSFAYNTVQHLGTPYHRPVTITSNRGYFISLTYKGNDFAGDPTAWATVASATLYSSASPTVPLRRLTYAAGATVIDSGSTVDDPADDRTYVCSSCGGTLGVDVEAPSGTLQLPGEATAALQATQHPAAYVVSNVIRDGVPWTYSYLNLRLDPGTSTWLFDRVTVTGPNGFSQAYTMAVGGPPRSRFNVMTRVTDSIGRETDYQIDFATYRITRVTYPEDNAVSVQYDTAGNIVSRTMHAKPASGLADITETANYTLNQLPNLCQISCWRPNWRRDALNRQTDYAYNSKGQLTEQIEPADASGVRRRTSTVYALSPAGISRVVEVRTCPDAGVTCGTNAPIRTEYVYWDNIPQHAPWLNTSLPRIVRQIDAATGQQIETSYTYDVEGRLLSTDGPLPGTDDTTYNRYDIFGRKSWEIGPLGANGVRSARRTTYRNSDDKPVLVENGTVPNESSPTLTVINQTALAYDSRRNPIGETVSAGATTFSVTQRTFDDRNRLECEARRMNPAIFASLPASACTPGTQGTGANDFGPDRITRTIYDAASQRLQLREGVGTSAEGTEATWAYNLNGLVTTVIDGNGNRAELRYDGHMRQDRWTFPSTTRPAAWNDSTPATALATAGSVNASDYEAYTYDAAGNRLTLRKRDGLTLTYTYDNLNRMILKVVPERPGLDPTHTRDVHYGYDLRNAQLFARFDNATAGADGVTNVYDGFGRLTSSALRMDGVSRAIGSVWDVAGRRTRMTQPDGAAFTYAFDAASRLTGLYQGTDTSVMLDTFTYDPQGLPATRAERHGSSAAWSHDPVGRLTGQTDLLVGGPGADVTYGFSWNPASQIRTATRDNDAYAWTGASTASRAYTTNGLNQYGNVAGTAFGYDANGNLTSEGARTFTYDVENRLVGASPAAGGTGTVSLRYDPLGRLYEVAGPTETRRFVWDGDALTNEYNAGGNMTDRYVHGAGAGVDDPLVWYDMVKPNFFHADRQGSIIGITTFYAPPRLNAYDEYGVPRAGNVGRFQYTGQLWLPDLGMYHYKARVYSPTLGRFLQVDPVGYEDQFNLYAYVGNDPVNRVDPSGRQTWGPANMLPNMSPAEAHEAVRPFVEGMISYPIDLASSVGHYIALSGLTGDAARNRARLVEQLGTRGLNWVSENPGQAIDIGANYVKNNASYVLGRLLVGGSASFLIGRLAGVIPTSTALHGGAVRALNGLVSQLERGGIDARSFNNSTLGNVALAGGLGARVGFNARTGNVTATISGTPIGSRISRNETHIICNVNGDNNRRQC